MRAPSATTETIVGGGFILYIEMGMGTRPLRQRVLGGEEKTRVQLW